MRIDHQVVVFDAADLAAESSFWAGVLDGKVDAEDDWHMVIVEGEPRIGVQLAPNHIPPGMSISAAGACTSTVARTSHNADPHPERRGLPYRRRR